MASTIIHLAVAKEVNKKLQKNKEKFYIGSIAPDIAKFVGLDRTITHFIESGYPNLNKFLAKYKDNINDDFVMGYYVHLFTDYLWFKYFLREIYDYNIITKLDGTTINYNEIELIKFIYSDYTNLNIKLIEYYDMDLKLFYNKIPKIDNIIEEYPVDKTSIMIDELGVLIENSKTEKEYLFNIDHVVKFISFCSEIIVSEINKLC